MFTCVYKMIPYGINSSVLNSKIFEKNDSGFCESHFYFFVSLLKKIIIKFYKFVHVYLIYS